MDFISLVFEGVVNPATISSLILNLIWFLVAVILFRLILSYINHSETTGKEFDFGEWLDSVGKSNDQIAKALVLAAFIISFSLVVSSFNNG